MDSIRRDLLWETIRYIPEILFILQHLSKSFLSKLKDDIAFFAYFLEEQYQWKIIRQKPFRQLKLILRDILNQQTTCIPYFSEYSPEIILYDVVKRTNTKIRIGNGQRPQILSWTWARYDTLFFLQWNPSITLLNIDTQKLYTKCELKSHRTQVALITYKNSVYIFGGYKVGWKNTVDRYLLNWDFFTEEEVLPEAIVFPSATRNGSNIFITGKNTQAIYQFSIENSGYTKLFLVKPELTEMKILLCNDDGTNLFVIYGEHGKVAKYDKKGNELRCVKRFSEHGAFKNSGPAI